VSIEDVMEAIVGDIEDEHDEDETPELHASGDGGWIAEARASLDAVTEATGFDFSSLPEAEDVDTIGGLVTAAAGRVPDRGEILLGPGEFEYEVLDADPRRIKRVKIRPLAAEATKPRLSLPTPQANRLKTSADLVRSTLLRRRPCAESSPSSSARRATRGKP
jgi:CBS domain containing-hemolysin-like protein